MNLKYLISKLFVIGTLFLLTSSLFAQDDNGLLVDEIIAKVDNYIILKSDLEGAHQQALSSGQYSANMKCEILAQLITQKLMVAHAEIDSVEVTDEEVNRNLDSRIRMIVQQTGGSEEKLEEYYGKSMDDIREEIKEQVEEQLIIQSMQAFITEGIEITPAEIKRFYNNIPKDSIPFFSTEVQVGHIVSIPEVGRAKKDEAKRKLLDLKKRIENGEDFGNIAKEYSQGPSGRFGGDLGFVSRGDMVPEYEAGALSLKPGEISDPVETEFGLHIIELIERRGNEYNSRHILLQPEPSPEDIQKSISFLDSLRMQIKNDSISFEKAAKEHSKDRMTSSNGGYFSDATGASFISVENLDPVVFFTIDSMDLGEISKPITFRTDDGKEAARIIYYKSKVKPHEANLKQDWQKIQAAALNEKNSKILQKWFKNARQDVFISIDNDYDLCGILE
ncbi:MAG: peptidylprolyl isomerase [Cyclobacteriaceae bacterium]|nr:peptidylprolyl isomerase [Cyclobacteriaceae bacterium]